MSLVWLCLKYDLELFVSMAQKISHLHMTYGCWKVYDHAENMKEKWMMQDIAVTMVQRNSDMKCE